MASGGIPIAYEHRSHISQKRGQFRYFDQQLGFPDWSRLTILDFGGNVGTFLDDAGSRIDPKHYWCLDITAEAIEFGRRKHPHAHWVFYDRHNPCFNPAGIEGLKLPELEQTFDCILAYSVFTHILPSEMQELVTQLASWLRPRGQLAFTLIDPRHESWPARPGCSNLQWRLERLAAAGAALDVANCLGRARNASWFALVNDGDLYVEDEALPMQRADPGKSFDVYYTVPFIRQVFPRSRVKAPVWGEMQHCCILGR